jgi:hypothetical protein
MKMKFLKLLAANILIILTGTSWAQNPLEEGCLESIKINHPMINQLTQKSYCNCIARTFNKLGGDKALVDLAVMRVGLQIKNPISPSLRIEQAQQGAIAECLHIVQK